MQNNRKIKFIAGFFIFFLYFFPASNAAQAAALMSVSDTLTTSKPSQKAVHTISVTSQNEIPNGGKISITFQGSGTNPNSSLASSKTFSFNGLTTSNIKASFSQGSPYCSFAISLPSNRITCTIGGSKVLANTEVSIFIGCSTATSASCTVLVPTLINPSKTNAQGTADIWNINVKSTDSSGNEIDFAKTKVAIIETVEDSTEDTTGPTPPPPGTTEVSAKVGDFYLNLSGLASPFASVVLSDSSGNFMASTVADSQGFFSINNILIKKGFSGFCLLAVDFKKISDSYTCINIPPAKSNVTKNNIFLPPSLGLSKSQVGFGEDFSAFGYTMPNAQVNLDFGKGIKKAVFADTTGYYIFRIENLPEGRYELFSTSKYKELVSLSPTKKVELKSLSLWEQILSYIRTYWFIWLIPIIIIIFLIIFKLWPNRFTSLYSRLIIALGRTPKETPRPHHFWLFGY